MAEKKGNPLIGAFRDPALDIVQPENKAPEKPKPDEPAKPTADTKATKAAEAAKPPAKAEKPKPEEPAKPAADTKAVKAAEPAKSSTPAAADKPKPEEPPKSAADTKAVKAAEPAKSPAPAAADKPKPEEPAKPAADTKAAKAAEPTKTTAVDVKQKSEEAVKSVSDTKAVKAAEPAKNPAADAKPKSEAALAQEVEIPKDFKMPINQKASESVTTLPLHEIKSFEGHPFSVKDDKDMQELVESVKRFGILEPVVVIPCKEYGYEMVSGHRRLRACQLAGITKIPVIVRNLDRDEAIISMVDANLKRENITPMEKARAYEMKLAAMKRKTGRRSKAEAAKGEKPVHAIDELSKQTGESRPTIQRIVRLNKLEPELQQMVDKKELPVNTAADISYLKKEEQKALADAIQKEAKVPSGTQAAELKKASQAGTLTQEQINKTVAPTKREENPALKVTFSDDELRAYFPEKGVTVPDVKRAVFEGLDLRKRVLERQKANAQQGKDAVKKNQIAR